MSALTLTPRALYEEVAEQLRQRIFRRELEPGSWIDELKIAEEFGISRTPLRERACGRAADGRRGGLDRGMTTSATWAGPFAITPCVANGAFRFAE